MAGATYAGPMLTERVPVTTGLDWLLDKAVLPGYSAIGPRLRRRWWPADPAPGCLTGRRALVTGATSGLGTATAVGLARLGATVHLLGRDAGRTDQTREDVAAQVAGANLVAEVCDVSDLRAVRDFSADLLARVDDLHVLVHNAGVMPPERSESAQGHELALATHVLGPFAMTALLHPALQADGDARVVWVSSGGMYGQRLEADDLEYTQGSYSPVTAYARTKRMQVVLAEQLAARWAGSGVSVHSMHPGWVDTPGIAASLPRFHRLTGPLLRDPAGGADTVVWLAAAPEVGTGLFWHDRRPRPTAYGPWQREPAGARDRLWQQVVALAGVSVD